MKFHAIKQYICSRRRLLKWIKSLDTARILGYSVTFNSADKDLFSAFYLAFLGSTILKMGI